MKKTSKASSVLILCILGGCAVPAAFVIAGAAFVIGLELLESFRVTADADPVRQAAVIDLDFPSQPADQPANASFSLNAQNVQAVPLDVAKVRPLQQSGEGRATVDLLVAAATTSNPCTNGTSAGQFTFSFDGTNVNIDQGSFVLPSAAFDFVQSGSFTLCLGVSANVDAEITIDQLGITFGPVDTGAVPECDSASPSSCGGVGRCNDGECESFTCGTDNPCPSYLRCDETRGVCTFRECSDTVRCPGEMPCTDGLCNPIGCHEFNPCSGGLQCSSLHVCVPSSCTAGFGTCGGVGQCTEFGECGSFACGTDKPCPSYLRCDETRGVCTFRECSDTVPCPGEMPCTSGLCNPIGCHEFNPCPGDLQCSPLRICVPSACAPADPGSCGSGQCNQFGECVPKTCDAHAECLGQRCNEFGECVSFTCNETTPCPSHLDCVSGVCERPACIPSPTGPCREPLVCDFTTNRCNTHTCSNEPGFLVSCPIGSNLECNSIGVCVPKTCDAHAECLGQRCNEFGECVSFTCNETTPCPSHLDCVSGVCERPACIPSPTGPCREPLVCDFTTNRCNTHTCSNEPGFLVSCPIGSNLECNSIGVCVPKTCDAHAECLGQRCNEFGECVSFTCNETTPCPSHLDCVSGVCERPACIPSPTGPCREPLVCDFTTNRCNTHTCSNEPGFLVSCPIGSNLECNSIGVCVPKTCDAHAECHGQRCNEFGECVSFTCNETTPCPSHLDCVSGVCERPACIPSPTGPCREPLVCDFTTNRCNTHTCSNEPGFLVSCPIGSNLECNSIGVCVPKTCDEASDCDSPAQCNAFGECITPTPQGTCGDGVCEASAGELDNCLQDCPAACGDGICNASSGEIASCPQDCPEVQCCVDTGGCPSEELFSCPGDCCCCGAGAKCVRPEGVWICGF